MPELPEVEIHRRRLERLLVGRRAAAVEVRDPRLAAGAALERLQRLVPGALFAGARRHGKYLLLDLEALPPAGRWVLLVHLRMTGKLWVDEYPAHEPNHARLAMALGGGGMVWFQDTRRFGTVALVRAEEEEALPELAQLGPDALHAPPGPAELAGWCAGSRRAIKLLLMDQRLLAGIGNICACEILYRAGVAPDAPAGTLGAPELVAIAGAIPRHLEWALAAQARQRLLYLGEPGAENVFHVYGRAGQPCPRCGESIVRTVLGGRGTFSCPGCQRPGRAAAPGGCRTITGGEGGAG